MRFERENTLLLAVDYQEKLVPAMENSDNMIKETCKLVKGMGILGVPVIFTQQYTKGLGMTVEALQKAYDDGVTEFEYYDKKKFSCYDDENIRKAIDDSGRKNIVLCGIESHICVLYTAIDLIKAGYNVMLAVDCISSRKSIDMKYAIKRAAKEGVLLSTVESVLFDLTGGADMEGFKEISKLIK